jgi:cell division protein FtsB
MALKKQLKKKNVQDATLKNIRLLKAEIAKLKKRVKLLEAFNKKLLKGKTK